MDMSQPLTRRQKRAALLLAGGMKPLKVARIVGCHRDALRKWRKHPKFKIRLRRLEFEFDQYIEAKQKSLLDKTFRALERMLDSPRAQSVQFAIDKLLIINKRYPETSTKHVVEGEIGMKHSGSMKVKTKHLKPEKKAQIKELLDQTRDLMSQN